MASAKTSPKRKSGKPTPAPPKKNLPGKPASTSPKSHLAGKSAIQSAVPPSREPTSGCLVKKRMEVVYKGRVQGVGFRFNVEQTALSCGVTGWVRNEHNGDVQVVAEGTEERLARLLEGVRKSPVGRHIVREQIRWETPRGEFCDFRIEYHN